MGRESDKEGEEVDIREEINGGEGKDGCTPKTDSLMLLWYTTYGRVTCTWALWIKHCCCQIAKYRWHRVA